MFLFTSKKWLRKEIILAFELPGGATMDELRETQRMVAERHGLPLNKVRIRFDRQGRARA